MTFAETLHNARTAMNLTQKELAMLSGVSLRSIQYYELGEKVPKHKTVYAKLAKALGINEDSFFADEIALPAEPKEESIAEKSKRQAETIVRNFRIAIATDALMDDDLDYVKDAVLQIYQDAKAFNARFRVQNAEEKKDNEKNEEEAQETDQK